MKCTFNYPPEVYSNNNLKLLYICIYIIYFGNESFIFFEIQQYTWNYAKLCGAVDIMYSSIVILSKFQVGSSVILPHLLIQSAMTFCHRLFIFPPWQEGSESMVEKVHLRKYGLIIDISKYIMGQVEVLVRKRKDRGQGGRLAGYIE